jgi:uncharacterized membrane protein
VLLSLSSTDVECSLKQSIIFNVKKNFSICQTIHLIKISGHFHYFIATDYLSSNKVSEMRRSLESIQILKSIRVLRVLCCTTYSYMIFVKDYAHVHLTVNSCS